MELGFITWKDTGFIYQIVDGKMVCDSIRSTLELWGNTTDDFHQRYMVPCGDAPDDAPPGVRDNLPSLSEMHIKLVNQRRDVWRKEAIMLRKQVARQTAIDVAENIKMEKDKIKQV